MQCVCGLSRHDLSLLQLLSKQTRSTEYDKHMLDLRSRFRAWNTVPCVEHNLCRYSVRHKDLLVAQNTCLDFGPKNRTDPRDQNTRPYIEHRLQQSLPHGTSSRTPRCQHCIHRNVAPHTSHTLHGCKCDVNFKPQR